MISLLNVALNMFYVVLICFLFGLATAIVKAIIMMFCDNNKKNVHVIAYDKKADKFSFLTEEQKDKFFESELYKRITEHEQN